MASAFHDFLQLLTYSRLAWVWSGTLWRTASWHLLVCGLTIISYLMTKLMHDHRLGWSHQILGLRESQSCSQPHTCANSLVILNKERNSIWQRAMLRRLCGHTCQLFVMTRAQSCKNYAAPCSSAVFISIASERESSNTVCFACDACFAALPTGMVGRHLQANVRRIAQVQRRIATTRR